MPYTKKNKKRQWYEITSTVKGKDYSVFSSDKQDMLKLIKDLLHEMESGSVSKVVIMSDSSIWTSKK